MSTEFHKSDGLFVALDSISRSSKTSCNCEMVIYYLVLILCILRYTDTHESVISCGMDHSISMDFHQLNSDSAQNGNQFRIQDSELFFVYLITWKAMIYSKTNTDFEDILFEEHDFKFCQPCNRKV